jgi:integrase
VQSNFRKLFQSAGTRAGIEPVPRVHDLRHSAASFMARAGFTLLEAAQQLGHSTTAMTERYSHVFPDARQAKVRRLDDLFITQRSTSDDRKRSTRLDNVTEGRPSST